MTVNALLKSLLLSVSLLILANPSSAQPAGARGDNFVYVMQRDDTVGSLAERFTSKPGHWRQIKAYNKISNVHAVPVGKQILIPFKYIDTIPEQAQVSTIVGEVYADEQRLSLDHYVKESQIIRTGPDSSVTFSLSNGSTMAIAPNSVVTIQRLRSFSGTDLIDAIFTAQVGSFTADVNTKNTGVGRFEIRTPVSITGIRGTELRNHVDSEGNTIVELLSGHTDISAAKQPDRRQALAANQGIQISTQGKLGTAVTLPSAPKIQTSVDQVKNQLELHIQTIPEAQDYLVRYTADQEGFRELARFSTREATNVLPLPQVSQQFFVQVRSINAQGMGGDDQTQRIILQSTAETDSTADKP